MISQNSKKIFSHPNKMASNCKAPTLITGQRIVVFHDYAFETDHLYKNRASECASESYYYQE